MKLRESKMNFFGKFVCERHIKLNSSVMCTQIRKQQQAWSVFFFSPFYSSIYKYFLFGFVHPEATDF